MTKCANATLDQMTRWTKDEEEDTTRDHLTLATLAKVTLAFDWGFALDWKLWLLGAFLQEEGVDTVGVDPTKRSHTSTLAAAIFGFRHKCLCFLIPLCATFLEQAPKKNVYHHRKTDP